MFLCVTFLACSLIRTTSIPCNIAFYPEETQCNPRLNVDSRRVITPLFTGVRGRGIIGSSELPWCSVVLCATAHIHPPQSRVCCLRYVTGRRTDTFLPSPLYKRGGFFMRRTIVLLTTMALTVLAASGVALAVTKIGSAGAQSSVVGPGESIQEAVNAAHPGDTIVVRGVHREDVVINKNGIKLRGDDAVIEAPPKSKADSPCSRLVGPEAICVWGDFNIKTGKLTGPRVSDVSVSGFTIRGFKIKGKGDNTAFVIDVAAARNATFVGNRLKGNVASGIR